MPVNFLILGKMACPLDERNILNGELTPVSQTTALGKYLRSTAIHLAPLTT